MQDLTVSQMLPLDDVSFLRAILARYPETALLAGAAETSPEGNPKLKPEAFSYKVFKGTNVDETAVEAERTFLGLLLFKAAVNGDKSFFPALSEPSFQAFRAFTAAHAGTDEDKEFLLYSLACNDLGKTQALIDEDVARKGRKARDHDRLMAELVREKPALFPGLRRLSREQQEDYRAGLDANFNLGQMVQGENLPADLTGIQAVGEKARNLRLLAELYDFAGATGHVRNDASILLTEDNLFAYQAAATELMREPKTQAYQRYIAHRADKGGISADDPDAFVLGRIAALSRSFTVPHGDIIKSVWRGLPDHSRAVLRDELAQAGSSEKPGILLYYAPAVIANAVKSSGDLAHGLKVSLLAFADAFRTARAGMDSRNACPVLTVNMAETARRAAQNASWIVPATSAQIPLTIALDGERPAFIGVGGGSDCVQAAILAKLSGKPACVVSIRTEKTGSQGASGGIGEVRTVADHGGEVADGIYRVTPATTGSGRFLESIPAELGLPTYLVIDRQDGTLTDRLRAVLKDFGGVDAVYGVDTGGDCLCRQSVADRTRATPDQDLASFRAIAELGVPRSYSLIVAPGVDSPPYASEIVAAARARQVFLSRKETDAVLSLYRDIGMDGSDDSRIGKTALAWQAALAGKRGSVRLSLPDRLVNDPVNPWNPVVTVSAEMAGAWIMRVADHLRALGPVLTERQLPRSTLNPTP